MKDFVSKLNNGEVIVIPTETVFGLAASAGNDEAIERIYQMKGRSENKPLQVMVSGMDMAKEYAIFDDNANNIADKYWPGSLTMILRNREGSNLSDLLDYNGTIGLRVPDNKRVIDLIDSFGMPLAVTSANLSNEPPILNIRDIKKIFGNEMPIYADKNENFSGVASTIIDLADDNIKILREGRINGNDLLKVCK